MGRRPKMKRIFNRIKQKIVIKELPPPPYQVNANGYDAQETQENLHETNTGPVCEVLDLLANCKIISNTENVEEPDVEYAEIQEMGLWHSTPLSYRHKSKISLTWILRENLENKSPVEKIQSEDKTRNLAGNEVDRYQRHNQKFNENESLHKTANGVKDRITGRNEYYHNLRFRSSCDKFGNQDTCSDDTSVVTEAYARKKHKHRHRRKKKNNGRFGYDIKDLDRFLTEASIDRPGNIPVVIAYPTTLYQTQKELQRELTLPLGTVVNAVFKNQQWVYVQTPHGDEGYAMYSACLPLGILPNRSSPQKKTPCWESSTDIYPQPCGNLTDNEKEQLRGRTRSECRYRPPSQRRRVKTNSYAEKNFDSLYLKTKSVCSNIDKGDKENFRVSRKNTVKRQILLVINSDYVGNISNKTLTVQKGDVVVLIQRGFHTHVDAEWFYVRKKDGSHGFIPAVVAGHGYI